jgi:hypothetical protein
MKFVKMPYGYPDDLPKEYLAYWQEHCQHIPYEACNAKIVASAITNGEGWMGVYHGAMQLGHDALHLTAQGAKKFGETWWHDLLQNVDGTGVPGPISHFILKVVGSL